MKFRQDVEGTDGLKGHFRKGLQALKPVDRARLSVENTRRLAGSVDVDSALMSRYPDASRWDYVVGYREGVSGATLYWIEVHPASREHNTMEIGSKFEWLLEWASRTKLHRYSRRYRWVASGKCSFTSLHPRIKALAQRGVILSGSHLSIPDKD